MNGKTVFLDGEITQRVENILEEARQRVIFVTPYLRLWGHLKTNIEQAVKKGVDVRFLIRQDRDQVRAEDVDWLRSHKVTVLEIAGLHAKIYMNEQTLLVSSMNITESSTNNSYEVALEVEDALQDKALREYVSSKLMSMASSQPTPARAKTALTWAKAAVKTVTGRDRPSDMGRGRCIRCHAVIEFNDLRPLCEKDYQIWNVFANGEYQEQYCHSCGREAAVTYSRPLCPTCYRKYAHR